MKTIFWNVDTQYDFMRADGKLNVKDAEQIEGNLETITKLAANEHIQVVNTADWHYHNSTELSDKPDYMQTFPEHCMAGTPGAAYVAATNPITAYVVDWQDETFDQAKVEQSRNIIIRKDAFDVFTGNKHTDAIVEMINPDRVIVYGVASNVCVDQAVEGLKARGKEVYVVQDAIKELPGLPLEATLEKWQTGDNPATLIATDKVQHYLR